MEKLSLSFYIITIIWALLIVPFTIFFYEGVEEREDGEGEKGWAALSSVPADPPPFPADTVASL